MLDFIIITSPRSGSHMLATAIDCMPDVHFLGEYKGYNAPHDYHPDRREFFIVHADQWALFCRNENPVPLRKIFLTRGKSDRWRSRRVAQFYANQMHYSEHVELSVPSNFQLPSIKDESLDPGLMSIMDQFTGLELSYEELTGGVNIEFVPEEAAARIKDHLNLTSDKTLLRPSYVKPTLRIT